MIKITLKQMRYARAVAEQAHFGRAARQCNISQSALSQQIQHLEEACGAVLFDRLNKSAQPTPFGREFLDRATNILTDTEALMAFAASQQGKPARPLRFGLIPTVAPYLLPGIYAALECHLPQIDFNFSERRTEQLLENLQTGALDIALIATDPPSGSHLVHAPLFADPFVLATNQSSNIPDPANLGDIPKNAILLLDEGHCLRDQAIEACALTNDDKTRNSFAATSLSTIVEFVASGQGVTLLPTIALKKETANPQIKIHALTSPGAGRLLCLVWREATPFSDLFAKITKIIKTEGETRLVEAMPENQ